MVLSLPHKKQAQLSVVHRSFVDCVCLRALLTSGMELCACKMSLHARTARCFHRKRDAGLFSSSEINEMCSELIKGNVSQQG
jgi:hypothetical protein